MPPSSALFRNKSRLKEALKDLPPRPGVYRFYDVSEALVYVGKSVCLRDRVRSYFTGKPTTKKLRRMRQEITRLEWEETGSELEALLLESRLVKRHQPRFNVMLRGFVPLPYVRVDLRDPFPRFEICRSPGRDGATYFGPFRSQNSLEAAVGTLTDALQLRTCPDSGDRFPTGRACYREELGTCVAPCVGRIAAPEYQRLVESACAVFEGSEQSGLQALKMRMERAAERLQFEVAARIRDAMRHIQAITGRQQALVSATRDLSLVAACPSRREDRIVLFVFRSGHLVFQQDVSREELTCRDRCETWTVKLLTAGALEPPPATDRIDSALLDEIQIVTAWMRQKTREGEYWHIPGEADPGHTARELALWLARQGAAFEGGMEQAA